MNKNINPTIINIKDIAFLTIFYLFRETNWFDVSTILIHNGYAKDSSIDSPANKSNSTEFN
jgi:hypothetical protein